MDPHFCPKHQMSYFEDECPRCERDQLRASIEELETKLKRYQDPEPYPGRD